MTAERWGRVKELFQTASELEPDSRIAYLDEACAGEPDLRHEVEVLLRASQQAEDFIEKPALQHSLSAMVRKLPDRDGGRRIGSFKVLRKIGEGGMGAVYEAIRDDGSFEQRVAVKVLKRGMDSDDLVQRFRNERQILAGLEHPNIARLLDGGATEDGLPYYVMEYIEGEPIDQYCDSHRLPIAARLKLYRQVCSAVAHAHGEMVVHRDIKPGNILITNEGVPKLLDFGIAKMLGAVTPAGAESLTATPFPMMTPAYASPEQVRGQTVTASSDIYSLGVLLYEVLTGHRPYQFNNAAPLQWAQAICEQEPIRPSAVVEVMEEIPAPASKGSRIRITPELVSEARGSEPKKLRQALKGDLDAIVLTALQKEPGRRYRSAQALSDDITRSLRGFPVLARSDTTGYRIGKWFVRRKYETALALCLALFAGVFGWEAHKVRTPGERHAASRVRPSVALMGFKNLSSRPDSAWLSTALTEMLSTELAAGEKLRSIPGERTAGARLELSLPEADSFGRDTLIAIRKSLGADYVLVGSYLATGEKDQPLRLDLRLQDASAGETLLAATESGRESDLASLVARAGDRIREKLGLASLSSADAERARASEPANAEAARLYSEGLNRFRLFDTLAARDLFQKAAAADPHHALTRSALSQALQSLGDDTGEKREARKAFELSANLSRENRLFVEGRYYESEHAWDKAVDIHRALYGFFPDSVDYGLRLAGAQTSAGRAKDALKTIDELRKLPPPASNDPRIDLEEAGASQRLSDYKRQLAAAQRAVAKGTAQGSNILVARARLLEAGAYQALDEYEKALPPFEDAKGIYTRFGHQRGVARALNGIGEIRFREGSPEVARKLHEEALDMFRTIGDLSGVSYTLQDLAILHKQQGDFDAAKRAYQEALQIRRVLGEPALLSVTLNGLANTLLEQGELNGVKGMYAESLAIAREGGATRMIARALTNLGLALREEGELADAKLKYQESISLQRDTPEQGGLAIVLHNYAQLLMDQGDLAGAKKTELESLAIQRKQNNKRGIAYADYQLGLIAQAEGDLAAAKKYQEDALYLRTGLDERNAEAQSRLALAEVNLDLGYLDIAQMFAQQAAKAFREQKTPYLEACADATLALSLALQKKFHEAQQTSTHAAMLAQKVELKELRISALTDLAEAQAAAGRRAQAIQSLEGLMSEAALIGLVPNQFEIRLALGRIEVQSGDPAKGRVGLAALHDDAASRGFGLIARKAADLLK